ncbi:MAG: hypothetical protein INR69_22110 [Mucilaginibacter polytrichastri]|nr:hypothetical protein [Mucilaginibacter polytrichastri]
MKRLALIALFASLFLSVKKADASFATENSSKELPVKITPAKKDEGNVMALMISGDGGWTNFDQDIASALAEKNIPVVGLNALKYFWKAKSPRQTTQDVTQLIEHYSALWHKSRIILIGYSFGADVMPFVYNRLVPALKQKVVSVGLLSPSRSTDFEVHVGDLVSLGGDDRQYQVFPEIGRMKYNKVFCFYGKEEDGFPVDEIPKEACTLIAVEGGHHYDHASEQIAGELIL